MTGIAELELGADLRGFKAEFRKARGVEAHLPARRWAKAAVRAIEETRFRILMFGNLLRGFGSAEALAEFCLKRGWEITPAPAWVSKAARLKEFSTASLREWKAVVRDLVREQMPDFHQRPEWAPQRNSAAARGRDTPGELQNAILDDICSALERIAPAGEMPKSAC